MKQGLVRLLYNFGKRFMGWTLHMIMCVLLCYPVSIRTCYQQGVLFLVELKRDQNQNITDQNVKLSLTGLFNRSYKNFNPYTLHKIV